MAFMAAADDGKGGSPAPQEKPKTLAAALERVTSFESEAVVAKQNLEAAEARATKAEADHKQAASQLEAAIEAGKSANEARDKALADLGAANVTIGNLNTEIATVKGDLSKANTNVSRLEGLCSVKGIDPSAAIPSEGSDVSSADEAIYQKWEKLNGAEKTKFFRANKEALDRYSAANEGKKA